MSAELPWTGATRHLLGNVCRVAMDRSNQTSIRECLHSCHGQEQPDIYSGYIDCHFALWIYNRRNIAYMRWRYMCCSQVYVCELHVCHCTLFPSNCPVCLTELAVSPEIRVLPNGLMFYYMPAACVMCHLFCSTCYCSKTQLF